MRANVLTVGEPAPWFTCRAQSRERYVFDTVAGRYIVLCFFGCAADPASKKVIEALQSQRHRFDDLNVSFFGVSTNPDDERERRIGDSVPGVRYLWDFDLAVSALYGAVQPDGGYRKVTYLLDPALRVVAVLPFSSAPEADLLSLKTLIDRIPSRGPARRAAPQAPVLVVPRIFEPQLCSALVDYYNRRGGQDSGFMRDMKGKTVGAIDYGHKRRRDCTIEDETLRRACMVRIHDRLAPEVYKAFQFLATRMERYIVACYDAAENGHFRPHRDNTTKGTAHRRFAISLFLNAGEYVGGFLRFPEFGPALYSAPTGGAVIFSCSLLHEATTVTKGRRYMFLPFLYDEAARRIREDNMPFLDGAMTGE
jgi:peroxiredoxin/predicted 2-oxoglutarate/Fe(II)-dependent dioxygenase YbiX